MSFKRTMIRDEGLVREARAGDASPANYERTLVTVDAASTLAVAAVVGGLIVRSGPTAGRIDTSPTAALLIAALAGMDIGDSISCKFVNTSGFTVTLAGGTDVTASGNLAVLTLTSREIIFIKTSATEMDMVAL